MASDLTTEQRRLHGSLVGTVLLAAGVVAFSFWVTADQDVYLMDGAHDMVWFLRKGECAYWFDEGYTNLSFIKQPVYPLFVSACYHLHVPLHLGIHAVYLAAAGFFAWSLTLRQTSPLVGLVVFAAVALDPMSTHLFQQASRGSLYTVLLLVTFGALVLQVKLRGKPGRWARRLLSGLALGLLWNTRPEVPWVVGLLAIFLGAAALAERRRHATLGPAVRAWLAEWAPPLAVLAVVTVAVMGANYARWGVFATSDMDAPGYTAAYRALLRIKPGQPIHHAPITREARLLAYSVSPSFAELRPHLEGEMGEGWGADGRQLHALPPGEIGAWFMWAIRDAAAEAGHCQTAPESEAYFRRIAEEINAAAAEGRVPTRRVFSTYLNPDWESCLPYLIPSWRRVWSVCWTDFLAWDINDADPGVRELYERVTRRRANVQPDPLRAEVRTWMFKYGGPMRLALAAGGLVALGVLFLRRGTSGRGAYFLTTGALGLVAFPRLAMLTLIDASVHSGVEPDYLFPANVMLVALAAWQLAEGTRLLVRAALGSVGLFEGAAASPSRVPASERVWSAVRTMGGVAAIALFTGVVLLTPPSEPESGLSAEGTLERVDADQIAGWAWDPERPGQPVMVDLYEANDLLGTVAADQLRGDRSGHGDGRHGFLFPTPERLKDGKLHQVKARVRGSKADLAGSGKFLLVRADFRERPVALGEPLTVNDATWKDGVLRATGGDPFAVFALPEARFVAAIRLRVAYQGPPASGPAQFQIFWRRSGQNDFVEEERNVGRELKAVPEEQTVIVQVNDTIDQVRLDPDTKPCIFRIAEVVLLVPADDYHEQLERMRKVVRETVPEGAVVLVVSKGDDEFLKLDGRTGWHFPRTPEGVWGGNPRDSVHAIDHLVKLQGQGAQYLVLPKAYFWWLDSYKEFWRYLGMEHQLVMREDNACIIFVLRERSRGSRPE